MSDTINLASTSQPKMSVTGSLSSTKSSPDGQKAVDAVDSSVSDESFQESIKKAFDDSMQAKEITDTESIGNDLPVLNNSPDLTADDSRLLAETDFNIQVNFQSQISDQLPAQNKSLVQQTIAHTQLAPADIDINVAAELNVLSSHAVQSGKIEVNATEELNVLASPVRQLLKIEPKLNAKNTQQTTSNITVRNENIDKPLIQQPEIPLLNTEKIDLPGYKSQFLTTAINQQQMLPNIQASLLSQTASAEVSIDSLPLLVNSSMNSFSAMNLQSIPQAEIVERFAHPAWSQGMGKQILWMVNQNINSAEIRLNPAHLGPIEVLIDMSEDQVNVSLSSRHAIVREAMEQALPKLREMLNQNGFDLAETDISQRSFAEQREQNAESNHRRLIRGDAEQSASAEISEQVIQNISASTAMVDYYI